MNWQINEIGSKTIEIVTQADDQKFRDMLRENGRVFILKLVRFDHNGQLVFCLVPGTGKIELVPDLMETPIASPSGMFRNEADAESFRDEFTQDNVENFRRAEEELAKRQKEKNEDGQ